MIPGMNPRMMRQAMKQLGMKEIEATEVIIKTPEKEIVISPASVQSMNIQGQQSYQVSGEVHERSITSEPEISEDDIETVMAQAEVDREKAIEAIEANNGDLAAAIMHLQDD